MHLQIINEVEEILRLLALGFDGMVNDFSEMLRQYLPKVKRGVTSERIVIVREGKSYNPRRR